MNFLETVTISITTGLMTGVVCYYLILHNNMKSKANIIISKHIARTESLTYKIKIVNRAKYAVTNLKAELVVVKNYKVPSGLETNIKILSLENSEIFMLDRRKKDFNEPSNTFKFVIKENLEQIVNNPEYDYIRFRLLVVDTFTSMNKVYESRYYLNAIKEGEFKYGDSIEIV